MQAAFPAGMATVLPAMAHTLGKPAGYQPSNREQTGAGQIDAAGACKMNVLAFHEKES